MNKVWRIYAWSLGIPTLDWWIYKRVCISTFLEKTIYFDGRNKILVMMVTSFNFSSWFCMVRIIWKKISANILDNWRILQLLKVYVVSVSATRNWIRTSCVDLYMDRGVIKKWGWKNWEFMNFLVIIELYNSKLLVYIFKTFPYFFMSWDKEFTIFNHKFLSIECHRWFLPQHDTMNETVAQAFI